MTPPLIAALHEALRKQAGDTFGSTIDGMYVCIGNATLSLAPLVEAVLAAQADPSEAVRMAGARALRDTLRWDNQIQRALAVWRAMLAELRKEKPPTA